MAFIILLLASAPAAWGSLLGTGRLQRSSLRHTARMQSMDPFPYAQLEQFSVTLTGCANGVGIGLDDANRVDMLVPEMP